MSDIYSYNEYWVGFAEELSKIDQREQGIPEIPNEVYCTCKEPTLKDTYLILSKFKLCTKCKKEYK